MTEENEKMTVHGTRTYRDRVMEKVANKEQSRIIPISFPKKTYKRFSQWAQENANDCFWLAIEKLIDNYETQIHLQEQLRRFDEMDGVILTEIARLHADVEVLKGANETPKRKSFGKKETEQGEQNE